MAKKIIKLTEQEFKNIVENTILKEARTDRRFRASVYVDMFVPETDDLEGDRERAKKQLEEILEEYLPNSYIGGIGYLPTGQIPNPKELDKIK